MKQQTEDIVMRSDRPEDVPGVRRLAALDSAAVPPSPLLLIEVGGEVLAAVSLATGAAIADPFAPTADLVALLRLRATQVASSDAARDRHRRSRLVRALSRFTRTLGARLSETGST